MLPQVMLLHVLQEFLEGNTLIEVSAAITQLIVILIVIGKLLQVIGYRSEVNFEIKLVHGSENRIGAGTFERQIHAVVDFLKRVGLLMAIIQPGK
jgi:hypothetical protein